ncbi:MAG: hypothetical protein JNM83_14875 [Myxococcales bacterium]|nr:hypothetical protein [Myxococcales bacterium]
MKKVLGIALLGLLVSVSACGPKAQNGGTTVAPPVGGAAPAGGTGGAAPSGAAPGAAPSMNANPGAAPAAP